MDIESGNISIMDLAKNVLLQYCIIPENIAVIQNNGLKTLWKFSAGDQILCLKRLKHSLDKAVFSVNAQIHIYNNGGKVPSVILNTSGEPITEYKEQLFVLYQWIEGRDLDFNNPSDLAYAMKGIAEFHLASKGYLPPADARISSKLGKWPNQYEDMRNRMIEWEETAKTKSTYPVYKTYLKWIGPMIEIANSAIERLNKSSYDILTSIEPEKSPLCHQDYGKGNALLVGEELYVLDLDGVTYDLPIRDLRKVIGKQAENYNQWNPEKIHFILKNYQRVDELDNKELELLIIDLLYPHWFFGTIKNLFQKNKSLKNSDIESIARLEQSKLEVLNKLF
ncbi:MAG: CotS family spore coat protein [Ignavibacteriales bacterium]